MTGQVMFKCIGFHAVSYLIIRIETFSNDESVLGSVVTGYVKQSIHLNSLCNNGD